MPSKQLKAGALLYATLVATIVAILLTLLILLAYMKHYEYERFAVRERLMNNSRSALELALAANEQDYESTEDLFEEDSDTVYIKNKRWGFYEYVTVKAVSGRLWHSNAALIGLKPHPTRKVSLYLADNNRALSLCGETLIKGLCYLPRQGPKRAYIEGKSFVGTQLIHGGIKQSDRQLPKGQTELLEKIEDYMNGRFFRDDSVVDFQTFPKKQLQHSFFKKSLLLYSINPIYLRDCKYSGNIIIASLRSIDVDSLSQLEGVMLFAPKITIRGGFTGSLQAFAEDTLYVNKEAHLQYPSALGLINSNVTSHAFIQLGEKAQVKGMVFSSTRETRRSNKANIFIHKDAVITGQAYCNGKIEMKGKVYGSLYVHTFVLNTPSSAYENHLLDVEINADKLPPQFAGVLVSDNKDQNKGIAKWLY